MALQICYTIENYVTNYSKLDIEYNNAEAYLGKTSPVS